MEIYQEVKILLREIEELLENQTFQLNKDHKVNNLVQIKRKLIKRIESEFLKEKKGIGAIIFHLNGEQNRFILQFLQYLQRQLYYLKGIIEKETYTRDINNQVVLLSNELQIILQIKDNKEFKQILILKSKGVLNGDIRRKDIPKWFYRFLNQYFERDLSNRCIEKGIIGYLSQIHSSCSINKVMFLFKFGIVPVIKDTINTDFAKDKDSYLELWKILSNVSNNFIKNKVLYLFKFGIVPVIKDTINTDFAKDKDSYLELWRILSNIVTTCDKNKLEYLFKFGIVPVIKDTINTDFAKNKNSYLNFIKLMGLKLSDIANSCYQDRFEILFEFGIAPLIENTINTDFAKDKRNYLGFIKLMGSILKSIIADYNKEKVEILFCLGITPLIENTINTDFAKDKNRYLDLWRILKNIIDSYNKEKVEILFYHGFIPLIENTINTDFAKDKKNYLEFINQIESFLLKIRPKEESGFKLMNILINKLIVNLNFKNFRGKLRLISDLFNHEIKNSKKKVDIMIGLENFKKSQMTSYILMYYLEYRKKALIDFIQNTWVITELNLDTDINFLEESIKPLTEMSEKELILVFSINGNRKTKLENFYDEICFKLDYKDEKELNQVKNNIDKVKSKIQKEELDNELFDYLHSLSYIFANKILNYLSFFIKEKIVNINIKEVSKFYEIFNFIKNEHRVEEKFEFVYKKIQNFIKLEDSYEKFLLSLGGWFSFNKRLIEIKNLIPEYKFKWDYDDVCMYFKFICKKVFSSSDVLESKFQSKISFRERLRNLEKINNYQFSFLEKLKLKSINGRSLTLYYRTRTLNNEKQMDDFDFFLICFILNKFIYEEYSKVFTKIRIVSRNSYAYPKLVHKLFPNIEYLNVSEDDFIRKTSIKSNSIYFNSGSVSEQITNKSITIVPISYKTHKDYNSANDDYLVFLNLFYWNYDESQFLDKSKVPKDESHSIERVMCEVLRAVMELEDRMIEQSSN